jgi:preprotein translocase subunit SecD
MMIRRLAFNIYLLGLAASVAFLICGCQSAESKHKKQLSTLHLHAETNPDPMGKSERVKVFRAEPFWVTIDKQPFLTEAFVKEARVIDVMGGFALQIQFDRQGTWILEQYTAALRGRHIAIFSQFADPGQEKLNEGRWLAAPLIATHITDGLLTFTPDATREEANQIALGLNNVAKKLQAGK